MDTTRQKRRRGLSAHPLAGLVAALASAAAFGASGPFVKPLLDAGWSPAAAVAVRAVAAGLVLLPFGLASVGWRGRVGAAGVATIGLVGAVPFAVVGGDVDLLDASPPWFVPMGIIVLLSTSFVYVTGVVGASHLGSRVASFVGLVEVFFAVLLSWALLDEVPTAVQAAGGALIVVGVVLVRSGPVRSVQ